MKIFLFITLRCVLIKPILRFITSILHIYQYNDENRFSAILINEYCY